MNKSDTIEMYAELFKAGKISSAQLAELIKAL